MNQAHESRFIWRDTRNCDTEPGKHPPDAADLLRACCEIDTRDTHEARCRIDVAQAPIAVSLMRALTQDSFHDSFYGDVSSTEPAELNKRNEVLLAYLVFTLEPMQSMPCLELELRARKSSMREVQ